MNPVERLERVEALVKRVAFPGYKFVVKYNVSGLSTVHVEYMENDVMTGVSEKQQGRRWILEPDASDMAIVQTCFKALLTSLEHRAREHFTFDNKALLQPHFSLQKLLSIAPTREVVGEPLPLEPTNA